MTSRPRVGLLMGRGPSSNAVANALADRFDVVGLALEERPDRVELVKRRIKRLGLPHVAGQLVFQLGISPLLARRSAARIAAIQRDAGLRITTPRVPTRLVDSTNNPEVAQWLVSLEPDVIVINGTRILKKRILRALGRPILNMHAGVTPAYRGVHGGYWALYEQDAEHCGVTVHQVDPGIDTGGVIAWAPIHPGPDDCFSTYPWLQIAAGIDLLVDAVSRAADGTLETIEPPTPHRPLRYHPTAHEYLRARWLFGVR